MIRISIKGFTWTTSPELLAQLVARAPALWESHPEIALAFAFGPPDDENSTAEFPKDADMESLVTAVLAVGQERQQLVERMGTALSTGQREEALTLLREYCNVAPKGDGHGGQETVH
jgi:hypothetical protein